MRTTRIPGLWAPCVLALALWALAGTAAAQGGDWLSSFNAGRTSAQRSGQALLVIVTQDGCSDCDRLYSLLRQGQVQSALGNAVKVRLDYPTNSALADRLGVTATPTVLVFSPESNYRSIVYRKVGSPTSGELVSLGRRIDGMARSGSSDAERAVASTASRDQGRNTSERQAASRSGLPQIPRQRQAALRAPRTPAAYRGEYRPWETDVYGYQRTATSAGYYGYEYRRNDSPQGYRTYY